MQTAWSFDKVTLKKMGISALLLMGGAVLDYIANNLLVLIAGFGIPEGYRPLTISVCTWLVAAGREFIKGKESEYAV